MENINKDQEQEEVIGDEGSKRGQNQSGQGEREIKKNQEDAETKNHGMEHGNDDGRVENQADAKEEKRDGFAGKILGEIKNTFSDQKNVNIYIDYRNLDINNGIQIENSGCIKDANFSINNVAKGKGDAGVSIARDNKRLREWINENYYNPSFALLIVIAVFNEMPYNWIISERGNLYSYLSQDNEHQTDTKAVEERLEEIGAEICMGEISDYTGKHEERFIRYGDVKDADVIMEYVWLQYPDLRMPLERWFLHHIRKGRNIYVKKITEALSRLACVDYGFFANHMVTVFYREKNISVDMTLSQILLYLKDWQSEKVISMLDHWSTQKRVHSLLTVLLVAGELQEEQILRKGIKTYLDRLYYGFDEEDDDFYEHIADFFAVGVRRAFYYRILIEELYELFFTRDTSPKNKDRKIVLFLFLFFIDIKLLVEEKGGREEAILVKMCIAPNSAKEQLCAIWQMVWNANFYRSELYQELGEYYRWLDAERLRRNILLYIDAIWGRKISLEAKHDIYHKIKRHSKGK